MRRRVLRGVCQWIRLCLGDRIPVALPMLRSAASVSSWLGGFGAGKGGDGYSPLSGIEKGVGGWRQVSMARTVRSAATDLNASTAAPILPTQEDSSTAVAGAPTVTARTASIGIQPNLSVKRFRSILCLGSMSRIMLGILSVRIVSRNVKPSLHPHNSAPAGYVTHKEEAHKMYQSFNDAMDAPGDTQPDSQIFRQYTSGIVESTSNLVPNPHPFLVANEGSSGDPPTDELEVVGSSQSQQSPTITSPTVIGGDLEMQYHIHDPLTSPLKFETPAIAGRKRNSQGHILSSAIRTATTPGTALSASAFFGFGNVASGPGMSLTQAFNATQAGTSPVVGAPNEDLVFQRPSPNFTRRSSPPLAMSSPIKNNAKIMTSSPALRSSSEPRADYETMKQLA